MGFFFFFSSSSSSPSFLFLGTMRVPGLGRGAIVQRYVMVFCVLRTHQLALAGCMEGKAERAVLGGAQECQNKGRAGPKA